MFSFFVFLPRPWALMSLCILFTLSSTVTYSQCSTGSTSNTGSLRRCSNWQCTVRIAVVGDEEGANSCRSAGTSTNTTPVTGTTLTTGTTLMGEEDFEELFGVVEDVPRKVESPSDYLSVVSDEQEALVKEAVDLLGGVCSDPCDRLGNAAEAVSNLRRYEQFRLQSGTNALYHFLHANKDGEQTTTDLLTSRASDLTAAIDQVKALLDQVGEDCVFLSLSENLLEEAAKPIAEDLFSPLASLDCPTEIQQPVGPTLEIDMDGNVYEKKPYVPSQEAYARRCAAKTAFMVQSSWSSNKGQIDQALELDKKHTDGDDERLKRELARDLSNAKQLEQGGYFYWMDDYLPQSYESLFGPQTGSSRPRYDALAHQTNKWLQDEVLPHGQTNFSGEDKALLEKYYTYMKALSNPNLKVREDCKTSTCEDYKKDYRPYIELRHQQGQPENYTMRISLTDLKDSQGRSLCDIGKQCHKESKTQLSQACDDLKSWTKDVAMDLLYARSSGGESQKGFSGNRNGVYSPGAIQSVSEYLYQMYTSSDIPRRALSGLSIGDGRCPKDLALHRTPEHLVLTGGGYEQLFHFYHDPEHRRDELQVIGHHTGGMSQQNFAVGLTTQDGGAELAEVYIPWSEWEVEDAEPIKVIYWHGDERIRLNDQRHLTDWQKTLQSGALALKSGVSTTLAFLSRESFEGLAYHLPAAWDMQAQATFSRVGELVGMDNRPEHWEFLSHAHMVQAKLKLPGFDPRVEAEGALSQFSDETIRWAYEEVVGRVELLRASDACSRQYPNRHSILSQKSAYERCVKNQLQAISAQYPTSGGRATLYAYLIDRFNMTDYVAGKSMANDDNLLGTYYALSAMGEQACKTSVGHAPLLLSMGGLRGGLSYAAKYGKTALVRRSALAANVGMHIGGFGLTAFHAGHSGFQSYKNYVGGHQLSYVHSMSDFTLNAAYLTSMSIAALRVLRASAKGKGTAIVPDADIYLHEGRTIVNDARIRTPARQRIRRKVFRIRPEDVAGKKQEDVWTAVAKQAVEPEGGTGKVTPASKPATTTPGTRPSPQRTQGTSQRGGSEPPSGNGPRVAADERTASPIQLARLDESEGLAIASPKTNTQTSRMTINWEDIVIPEGLKPGVHTITVPCQVAPRPRLLPPMFASGDQDGSLGEPSGEEGTPGGRDGSNGGREGGVGGGNRGSDGGDGGTGATAGGAPGGQPDANMFTTDHIESTIGLRNRLDHYWDETSQRIEGMYAEVAQASVRRWVADHRSGHKNMLDGVIDPAVRTAPGFAEGHAMAMVLEEWLIFQYVYHMAETELNNWLKIVDIYVSDDRIFSFATENDWFVEDETSRFYHIHLPPDIFPRTSDGRLDEQGLRQTIHNNLQAMAEYYRDLRLFKEDKLANEPALPSVHPAVAWYYDLNTPIDDQELGVEVDPETFQVTVRNNSSSQGFFNVGQYLQPKPGVLVIASPEHARKLVDEGVKHLDPLPADAPLIWPATRQARQSIPVFLSSKDGRHIDISFEDLGEKALIQIPQGGVDVYVSSPTTAVKPLCLEDAGAQRMDEELKKLLEYDNDNEFNLRMDLAELRTNIEDGTDGFLRAHFQLIAKTQNGILIVVTRGHSSGDPTVTAGRTFFLLPADKFEGKPSELRNFLGANLVQNTHLVMVQQGEHYRLGLNSLVENFRPGEEVRVTRTRAFGKPLQPGMVPIWIVDPGRLVRPVPTTNSYLRGMTIFNPKRLKKLNNSDRPTIVETKPISEIIHCPGQNPGSSGGSTPPRPAPGDGSSIQRQNDRGVTPEEGGRMQLSQLLQGGDLSSSNVSRGVAGRGLTVSRASLAGNSRNFRGGIDLIGAGRGTGRTGLAKEGQSSEIDYTPIRLVPNPTTSTAVIEGLYFFDDPQLTLLNGMGQAVQLPSWNALDGAIDLSTLAPGLYRLVVVGQSGKTASVSVVKR